MRRRRDCCSLRRARRRERWFRRCSRRLVSLGQTNAPLLLSFSPSSNSLNTRQQTILLSRSLLIFRPEFQSLTSPSPPSLSYHCRSLHRSISSPLSQENPPRQPHLQRRCRSSCRPSSFRSRCSSWRRTSYSRRGWEQGEGWVCLLDSLSLPTPFLPRCVLRPFSFRIGLSFSFSLFTFL